VADVSAATPPTRDYNVPPKHDFYLIQRLQVRPTPRPDDGFDGYFSLDYMGSAEFEFGAVGDSLRRIRGAGAATVVRSALKLDDTDRMAYFVGPQQGMDEKIVDLQRWLRDPRRRSKERSYFPEHFTYTASDYMVETAAWWSLDDDVLWTLDEHIAVDLITAFGALRVKR
jgi:hypothetical protein